MEPLDDHELNGLLRQWEAPPAPPGLRDRVWERRAAPRTGAWRWLLTGSIQVPVPVAAAALVVLAVWLFLASPLRQPSPDDAPDTPSVVSLADFQPVDRVELRLVGEGR